MISQADALKVMDSRTTAGDPIPVDITVITCNLTEDTGGERRVYQGVTLAGGQFGKKNSVKNPNHFENGTRNIMVPGKSRPITIHFDLITHLNGERVCP